MKLEPCDVLLYIDEATGICSLISKWGAGRFSHASLYIGEAFFDIPFLVESSGRGAVIASLQSHTSRLVQVMRPVIASGARKSVIQEAIKIASSSNAYYDYFTIARNCIPRILWEKFPFLPIPPYYVRDSMFICSELVAEAFWKAGIDVLPEDTVPLPIDFETSTVLSPMYQGRVLVDLLP